MALFQHHLDAVILCHHRFAVVASSRFEVGDSVYGLPSHCVGLL